MGDENTREEKVLMSLDQIIYEYSPMDSKSELPSHITLHAFLTLLKLFVGLLSGSLSILSEVVYSGRNLIAPMIAYVSVRMSGEISGAPSYEHEKYEDISGLIEAPLVIVVSLIILYEIVNRLFHPFQFDPFLLWVAIIVMGIATVADLFVLYPIMKREGDGWRMRGAFSPPLEVMVGLIFVHLLGLAFLDLLPAVIFSCLTLKAGFSLAKKSFNDYHE